MLERAANPELGFLEEVISLKKIWRPNMNRSLPSMDQRGERGWGMLQTEGQHLKVWMGERAQSCLGTWSNDFQVEEEACGVWHWTWEQKIAGEIVSKRVTRWCLGFRKIALVLAGEWLEETPSGGGSSTLHPPSHAGGSEKGELRITVRRPEV